MIGFVLLMFFESISILLKRNFRLGVVELDDSDGVDSVDVSVKFVSTEEKDSLCSKRRQ